MKYTYVLFEIFGFIAGYIICFIDYRRQVKKLRGNIKNLEEKVDKLEKEKIKEEINRANGVWGVSTWKPIDFNEASDTVNKCNNQKRS